LLGHENNKVQQVPKRIEALKNLSIQSIVCGGLHTLALTKEGHVYAWGKGEGGQLGLPINQLTHDTSKNTLYLSQPKRIKSALDGKNIIQIACGDAHSIALDYNGRVYGWGYTYYGQLGLGIGHENVEANFSCQIPEPRLIEKLANQRIIDIYAGATFSFFLNDKNELYGCGLNESNQIGLEKSITKISNQVSRYEPNSPMESTFPQKLECFTSMPVVQVACGEAHSLAVKFRYLFIITISKLVVCDSSYILFSWGIQKQGQLGLGDAQISNSTPRPVSFLQYVMPYSVK